MADHERKHKLYRLDYLYAVYYDITSRRVRKLANFAEIFTNGLAGLKRFAEVMRIQPKHPEKENALELTDVKGEIELKDVVFGYKQEKDVLHGISLKIHAGRTLAVVGHSGGGKSTLCQLIPRFYDVEKGSILLSMALMYGT